MCLCFPSICVPWYDTYETPLRCQAAGLREDLERSERDLKQAREKQLVLRKEVAKLNKDLAKVRVRGTPPRGHRHALLSRKKSLAIACVFCC